MIFTLMLRNKYKTFKQSWQFIQDSENDLLEIDISGDSLGVLKIFFNPYAAGGWFGNYKIMQKSRKITETLAHGYSSESTWRELSNGYQHGRV